MSFDLAALWLVRLLAIYAAAGFVFALWFAARGVERLDAAAHGATLGFRLILLPGTIALWPWLLRRTARADGRPPVESNAHRRAVPKGPA